MKLEQELYEKVEKETLTDYEGIICKDGFDYLITIESTKDMIQDLLAEVYHWKEQYEDLKQDLQENYKPINIEEQI